MEVRRVWRWRKVRVFLCRIHWMVDFSDIQINRCPWKRRSLDRCALIGKPVCGRGVCVGGGGRAVYYVRIYAIPMPLLGPQDPGTKSFRSACITEHKTIPCDVLFYDVKINEIPPTVLDRQDVFVSIWMWLFLEIICFAIVAIFFAIVAVLLFARRPAFVAGTVWRFLFLKDTTGILEGCLIYYFFDFCISS